MNNASGAITLAVAELATDTYAMKATLRYATYCTDAYLDFMSYKRRK